MAKNEEIICPFCNEGVLKPSTCPSCKNGFLRCDECESIYRDRDSLDKDFGDNCPHCGRSLE